MATAERRLLLAKKASTHLKRDPWVQLQAARNAKSDKQERDGHKEAFTDPKLGAAAYYPYWGITMFPAYGSVLLLWSSFPIFAFTRLQVLWRIHL
jgi:hypothetical protein